MALTVNFTTYKKLELAYHTQQQTTGLSLLISPSGIRLGLQYLVWLNLQVQSRVPANCLTDITLSVVSGVRPMQ